MPKRSTVQREKDLAELARRYLQGEIQALIAEDMGVTQQTISNDLRTLQQRWQKAALLDFDQLRAKELARIDHLELVYWGAWQQSKDERRITATEKREGAQSHSKASLKREERDGNPAFLAGVQWCIEKRCRLLGLDAPQKQEFSGPGGAPIPFTEVVVELPRDDE